MAAVLQDKGVSKIPNSWSFHQSSRQHNKLRLSSQMSLTLFSSTTSIHQLHFSKFLPVRLLRDLLLAVVILLKRLLQFSGDLLEEADLLTEVVLHLGSEVPYPRAVEMLDLCQGGAGNDVAAVVELALLLWTVLHLGQSTWKRGVKERDPSLTISLTTASQPIALLLHVVVIDMELIKHVCATVSRQVGGAAVSYSSLLFSAYASLSSTSSSMPQGRRGKRGGKRGGSLICFTFLPSQSSTGQEALEFLLIQMRCGQTPSEWRSGHL